MEKHRVIIAGGGTGGHIFPAIAIAQAVRRMQPEAELLFVGAKGRMEMEKVPKEGFEIIGLDIAGFDRSNMLKNALLPLKIFKSLAAARSILKRFRPLAVVGVGGYASFPMLFTAQRMGIPTLIQEQNSFAGRTNKILGRRAKKVCVAYADMDRFFPAGKIVYTGNPVRRNIAHTTVNTNEARSWFGLNPSMKVLLIIGGSLGARSINEAVDLHLQDILDLGFQIIWQTGKPFYDQAKKSAEGKSDVKVYEFIREMEYAYAAADIVISRAGALAIAELCIAARPVIFVPYPFAAEDHQTSNALSLVTHNAAELVKDNEAKTELFRKLKSLFQDKVMQELMVENLRGLAIKDADQRIAKEVFEIANIHLS